MVQLSQECDCPSDPFRAQPPALWACPVTSQGHPTLQELHTPKGTGLGFHAHKMPEIKAELTTWKVLKSVQTGGMKCLGIWPFSWDLP